MARRFSSLSRSAKNARRVVVAVVVGALFIASTARVSPADDVAAARRELAASDDFRVRTNAALMLGRVRPGGARDALERALADGHPAVRSAVVAALAALGDSNGIAALERRVGQEPVASVRTQLRIAIESLKRVAILKSAKYVVHLGSMRNNTSVRGSQLGFVLHDAVMSRASALPGIVVADANDQETLKIAGQRQLPVLVLDGSLTGLTQTSSGGNVSFRAQVLFSVRRDQSLKASMTGAATAFGSEHVLSNHARVVELQNDAVDGAVQSAMRGANTGLQLAAK